MRRNRDHFVKQESSVKLQLFMTFLDDKSKRSRWQRETETMRHNSTRLARPVMVHLLLQQCPAKWTLQ